MWAGSLRGCPLTTRACSLPSLFQKRTTDEALPAERIKEALELAGILAQKVAFDFVSEDDSEEGHRQPETLDELILTLERGVPLDHIHSKEAEEAVAKALRHSKSADIYIEDDTPQAAAAASAGGRGKPADDVADSVSVEMLRPSDLTEEDGQLEWEHLQQADNEAKREVELAEAGTLVGEGEAPELKREDAEALETLIAESGVERERALLRSVKDQADAMEVREKLGKGKIGGSSSDDIVRGTLQLSVDRMLSGLEKELEKADT